MKYDIAQKMIRYCRIIDVKLQTNRVEGSKFVVYKLGDYYNSEFLCSHCTSERNYNSLVDNMRNQKRYTIDRCVVRLHIIVYHLFSWDDVDRGFCSKEHIGEIQRDTKGIPIPFKQIVIYSNINNKLRPTINEILDKEYIEINSPYIQNYLNFNNQQYYLQQQKNQRIQKEMGNQEDYVEYIDRVYKSYETKQFVDIDMSEEDRIMSALENGDGELFGF